MPKTTIKLPKLSDARRLYEILSNPKFVYLSARIDSIGAERKWIKKNVLLRKNNIEWNYVILYGNEIVGAIGVKINYHRRYVGEIGYFIDEKFWGKGIASQAVKLIEKICFRKLKLARLEIIMVPANKASEKVAIKNGYKKEGLTRKVVRTRGGKMKDCYLYAKIK